MNSREKGKRGERYYANWLRDNFNLNARRGVQYAGGQDSPDVVGGFPDTHVEVKFVEALNIQNAMEQAIRDAGTNVPYVAHKRNRKEMLITLRADDLARFCTSVHSVLATISEHDEQA